MDKSKSKKKQVQPNGKLSFGSALKQNVTLFLFNIHFLIIQFKNTSSAGKKTKKGKVSKSVKTANKKPNIQTIPISKIDESYNTDKGPDLLNGKDEFNDYKNDRRGVLQDIQSESSSLYNSTKVNIYYIIILSYFYYLQGNAIHNKAKSSNKNQTGPQLVASLETFDGVGKKPFKATGLLNKSQLKLASYIKAHNDVTLHGTKRFTDKSGEYYLKNIQMQNRRRDPNITSTKNSLNNPQYLENCVNSANLGKIRRRASKIVTLLPENSLTPIPKKEGINKLGMANGYGKKELKNAERTAVFIRRMEYSTSMKKQMEGGRNMKNQAKKIQLIQEWWKTMFKIIKLQKNVRGFLFRKKLMSNLEHQEKLLQFITEFDNIHNYHLFRNFMDNLKKKTDYEKAKLMEKCEDFNEKLDNLEKLRDLKRLKECFEKWKNVPILKRKADYENLSKKLNDLLSNKLKKNNLETLKTIKDAGKSDDDKLNDKVKEFQERMGKNDFMKKLIRAHRLNKFLNNAKNKIDDRLKKEALDKLKKNSDIAKAVEKLQKVLDNNMKRDAWKDMKIMDFVKKLDDLMNKHNNKVNNDAKKEFLDKLKDINNKKNLGDKFQKWKNLNDEQKRINKILSKLRRYKQNELKKKAEEDKNKLCVSSGVNDFEVISDKQPDPNKNKNSQIFISSPNDINILAQPKVVSESTGPNFSLIAPEKATFKFEDPMEARNKSDLDTIKNQLKDADELKNKNDLKKYNDDDIAKATKKLDDLLNLKNKKDTFDTIRKTAGNNEGFKILDKLFKDKDNDLKKEALNNLKRNNDSLKTLEKLNKLLNDKMKKNFLDNLKKNADDKKDTDNLNKGLELLDKLLNNKMKKDAFDLLKKNNDLAKAADKLDKLINNKLKDDALKTLKDFADKIKENEQLRNKVLGDKIKKIDLKKYFDRWKDSGDKGTPTKKRVSHRKKMKKNKSDDMDDDMNLLREAFDIWRQNSLFKPKREILDQIKKNKLLSNKFDKLNNNEKNNLLEKYKHKMMQVLLNIYTRQRHLLTKKYFDKWRKSPKMNEEIVDEPKYKKKPRIEGKKDYTDSERDSFKPTYYNSKVNQYQKRYIPQEEINNEEEKEIFSETSSYCESVLGNGVYLTQVKKVISQARNYTSQSFFIDKNIGNSLTNNYQINTHNTNQLPMTMKGDFLSLIEKNPKILRQKNPRIQVTNATCDLDQIMNNETTEDELNSEEVDYEMEKLNNNFVINKSRVLSKVIKNCDKDLYAAQRPFKVKKDQWYSVSIPLNDNEAKWEFLNNIKGERDKNNLNKFELIQNEEEPMSVEKDNVEINPYSTKTYRNDRKKSANKDNSYRLREMNYSQFYRSPKKLLKLAGEDDRTLMNSTFNPLRRTEKKTNTRPFLNTYSRNWRNNKNYNIGSNNIYRNRGKIELDPKSRTIDFGYGDYGDSD